MFMPDPGLKRKQHGRFHSNACAAWVGRRRRKAEELARMGLDPTAIAEQVTGISMEMIRDWIAKMKKPRSGRRRKR